MLATLGLTTEACPGPHEDFPPVADEIEPGVAFCVRCGRSSRICPRCSGRSRPGALRCRLCGTALLPSWRDESWHRLGRGAWSPPVAAAVSPEPIVDTFATPAWVGLSGERSFYLCEPGPGMAVAWEIPRQDGEAVVDVWPEPGDVPQWRLATSRRVLALDARRDEWTTLEEHSEERGELHWRHGSLWSFFSRQEGGSLWVNDQRVPLAPSPVAFTPPAVFDERRRLVGGREQLHLVDLRKVRVEESIEAPEALVSRAPVVDPLTQRVYFATSQKVWWWKPGLGRTSPFVPAGGASLAGGSEGVVILEGDRIRHLLPDGRRIWDSQLEMPDLALSPFGWDRAGNTLLVPLTAARRPMLLLLDLEARSERDQVVLDGLLVAAARLAPGGVLAVIEEGGGSGFDRGRGEVQWLARSRPSETTGRGSG